MERINGMDPITYVGIVGAFSQSVVISDNEDGFGAECRFVEIFLDIQGTSGQAAVL